MFVLCPGRSKVDLSGKGVQKVLAGSSGGQKAKTSVFLGKMEVRSTLRAQHVDNFDEFLSFV